MLEYNAVGIYEYTNLVSNYIFSYIETGMTYFSFKEPGIV